MLVSSPRAAQNENRVLVTHVATTDRAFIADPSHKITGAPSKLKKICHKLEQTRLAGKARMEKPGGLFLGFLKPSHRWLVPMCFNPTLPSRLMNPDISALNEP